MLADSAGSILPVGMQSIVQGPVTAAGAEWEFTANPVLGNANGTLFTGFGQLKNRWDSLCLDASGVGASAVIDQTTCNGTASQAWTAQPVGDGTSRLRNAATDQTIGFNTSGCAPSIDAVLDLTSSIGSCGALVVTADSYTFFSDAVSVRAADQYVPHPVGIDTDSYSCAPGYSFTSAQQANGLDYVYGNYSAGTVTPSPALATDTHTIAAGTITYAAPDGTAGTGRVQLECQPDPGPSLGSAGADWSFAKVGATGTQLVEVNGNSTANGATVDTWQQTMAGTSIQNNEVWTYQPASDSSGYGQLVSPASGKCLEINGTTGAVDQWTCVTGAPNELWRAVPNAPGGTALQERSTGQYLATTTTNDTPSSWSNGTALTMRGDQSLRTSWALITP
jgi:hypothetical protein